MRVKTEVRRQAILDKAASVFREAGYEGASMSEIAARIGGSKATIYNYFSSKEELFLEVVNSEAEKQGKRQYQEILQTPGITKSVLQEVGEGLLKIAKSPEMVMMRRVVIAASGRSKIGQLYYELGSKEAWSQITRFLQSAIDSGDLRSADPHVMTMQLKSLYEAEISEQLLLGMVTKISAATITELVARAVDVFMRAYGTPKDQH